MLAGIWPVEYAGLEAGRAGQEAGATSQGALPSVPARTGYCQGKVETSCFQQNKSFRFGADGRSP